MPSTLSIVAPFILKWEGGLSNNPKDEAAAYMCPYPYNDVNYHTNKGITWLLWESMYGNTQASANRFFVMDMADWVTVAKKFFWDKNLLDQVNSQRIANLAFNWTWASGNYYPDKHIEHVLNTLLPTKIAEDGMLGPIAIKEINEANEEQFYDALVQNDTEYLINVAAAQDIKAPGSGQEFIKGWLNRMQSLVDFNKTNFKLQ